MTVGRETRCAVETEGFTLVPVRMTAAMINAWSGGLTVTTDEIAYNTSFQEAWSRVLAAAQSHQHTAKP